MRGELRQGEDDSYRGIKFEGEFSSEARWRDWHWDGWRDN